MNTIIIFLYVISVVMWWAGFNYAAARASTARRRKLFSTAATLALAWPFAFIALAAALATKAAANIMIAVGDHINNTWDAAVSDEGDTIIVTKLTPMGTAMRVRRENTEHDTDTANSSDEDGYTSAAVSEETSPALADNTLLMPPPPPPATDADDHDGLDQANTSGDETAQATANDTDMDDETVTIQKVTLSDLI
jgi:Kef-type K+ transport system membrane component KefB